MNKEMKDVFFKLSVKIDHTNDRIDDLERLCIHNNIQLDKKIDKSNHNIMRVAETGRFSHSELEKSINMKAEKTQIDECNHRIDDLVKLFTYNNIQFDNILNEKAEKTQVDNIIVEIEKGRNR